MVIAEATRMVPSLIEGAPEALIALWSTLAPGVLETTRPFAACLLWISSSSDCLTLDARAGYRQRPARPFE
jgi:hypothetical protein